jgi:hypothetical protein
LAGLLQSTGTQPRDLPGSEYSRESVPADTVVSSPGDTLVEVRQGDTLVLPEMEGALVVSTWDRPLLRAEVDSKRIPTLQLRRSGNRLELRTEERDRDRRQEVRITLPPWMNLVVSGRELDADVRGIQGDMVVRSLQGDLVLRDLSGSVEAYAVEGRIDAIGLSGTARLRTGDDGIRVSASSAALEVETVEGDVRLEESQFLRVRVQTTDGDVEFGGRLLEGGDYGFFSHDGDIRLRLEPPVNLEAHILAYDGEFRSDFPVRAQGFRSGEELTFVLGAGGCRLVVETFEGEIRLLEGSGGGSL